MANTSSSLIEKMMIKSMPSRVKLYDKAIDLYSTVCIIKRFKPGSSRRDLYGDFINSSVEVLEDDIKLVIRYDDPAIQLIDYNDITDIENDALSRGPHTTLFALVKSDELITEGDRVIINMNNFNNLNDTSSYEYEVSSVKVNQKGLSYYRQVTLFNKLRMT